MRLVLVPNAELGEHSEDYKPEIPLGLLSLATILSRLDMVSVQVLDPRHVDFQPSIHTAELLLASAPDVIGFSTMCNTYPYALRTAQLLKQIKPDITVVFGGPHATVVGKETLTSFAFVDFVLMGECEHSIVDFVAYLSMQDRSPADVPGLIFRQKGTAIQSGCNYPVLRADELPEINYELFPDLHDFSSIPLDVGRGCPFACTFCTTSVYWERRYRLRSAQYVIDTVKYLKSMHGLTSFGFVHDNFTASPHRVADFCEHIIASGLEFKWRCSARPDCVDSKLLELMFTAGCRSIFMGVESGSPRIQRLCNKRLKLDRVAPLVSKSMEFGIPITVSFITGFPYEEIADIERTLRMMSAINYEGRTSCDLQLHLLSPVPGAPLLDEPNVEIALDDTASDVSASGTLDQVMKSWIFNLGKSIFGSFYHYVNTTVPRQQILALRLGWFTLFSHLRVTALAMEEARRNDDFALVSVFDTCGLKAAAGDATAEFEWCVSSVQRFLENVGRSWAESLAAVLDFEAEIYRLRLSGGRCLMNCNYDVNEWVERAMGGAPVISFPRPANVRYFIMTDGEMLKIACLPV
ncbi:MAG: radical SAM protein [Syntrophobacteraceae bacterium]